MRLLCALSAKAIGQPDLKFDPFDKNICNNISNECNYSKYLGYGETQVCLVCLQKPNKSQTQSGLSSVFTVFPTKNSLHLRPNWFHI